MPSFSTSVGKVRIVGMIEGISFLLLMGVAMPLKYLAGIPEAVRWIGWIHGILFVLYCLVILAAFAKGRISWGKSVISLVAALFPFGPFLIDRKLAKDEEAELASS